MTLKEILLGGSGAAVIIMTLVQIAPIKVNPWSALARALGRAINGEVLKELAEVKETQKEYKDRLNDHIRIDDERDADDHRRRILQFNMEIFRGIRHTREDFIEILTDIDYYERYCKEHPCYKNNRAVHAIANITRVYDERLIKHDFAGE